MGKLSSIISLCLILAASVPLCAGEEDRVVSPDNGIGYRRVFVPADRPDVWPTQGKTFLPVDPQQFQDLLRKSGARGTKNEPASYAVEAAFYARYNVNRLIDGQGCIAITTNPEQPWILEWPSAGAIIFNPQWKNREGESVKLGSWGTSGAQEQRQGLLVEHAGELLFEFQTAATVATDESAQFSILSPRALRRSLYLDLPENYELSAEGGRAELLADGSQAAEPLLLKLPHLGLGYRRWLLRSGPGGTLDIRVKQPPRATGIRSDVPAYREQLTYTITPRGVELVAEYYFLPGRQLPGELTVQLASDLKPVSAAWEGSPINWQPLSAGATGPTRVRIPIPVEARKGASRLRIDAWSRLPRADLSVLPQPSLPDLFWSEGEVRLDIAEGLSVLDIRGTELTPIHSELLPSNGSNRQWHFAKLRPQAIAEIAVAAADAAVDASMGTSLELSSTSTKAVLRMQLRATGRSLPPRLEAEVNGDWIIDSVESSSVSGFTDWYVDQVDGKNTLRVQLREPSDAAYPGEVVVEAHLPKSAAIESLPLAELIPVEWRDFKPRRHVLAVSVIEPFDLQLTGAAKNLSLDDLTEEDWELLQNSDVAALVSMEDVNPRDSLQLLPERPTLEGSVAIAVHSDGAEIRHSAAIQLKTSRNPLGKVRVLFTPALPSEPAWIDPVTGAILQASRISASTKDERTSEVWEVQLPRGAGQQSLRAEWSTTLQEAAFVPLVALPDAVKQTATIFVGSQLAIDRELIPTGLVRHPLNTSSLGNSAPRAVFHYDPAQLASDSMACVLEMRPWTAGKVFSPTIIEHVELASQYSPQEESTHQADFTLHGINPIHCRLPDGAQLQRMTWDGQLVKPTLQANELRFEPPSGNASLHRLGIEFSLPPEPLVDGSRLTPQVPHLGLPLTKGRWSVQLPATVQLATADYLRSVEPGWRGRIFGPWAQTKVDFDSSSPSGISAPPTGWRTWEIEFAGALPPTVQLVAIEQRRALASVLGLLVACLTAWKLDRRPSLLVALLAVTVIAAIWLPPTSCMFATAAWLGMWLGIGWSAVTARLNRRTIASQISESTAKFPYATTTLLLIVLLFCPQKLSSQNTSPAAEAREPNSDKEVVEVLIPVDSEGQPSEDRYFVPAAFWEALLRGAKQEQSRQGGDWVILRGRYSGELHQDAAGGEVLPSLWNLAWDVEVQRRDTRVFLPLSKSQGKWHPAAVVDGIPVPLQWNSDGESCEITIQEPGMHRVALRVEPLVEAKTPLAKLQLRLPTLLDAELRLTYPQGLKELQLPDAATPTVADQFRSKVVVAMPHSELLEVSWKPVGQSSASATSWQVEQLELLSIATEGAELEAQFRLQGRGTPPPSILVQVDGELTQIDSTASGVSDELASGGQRTISAPVNGDPETGLATATIAFRLPRELALGNYRFPQVEVLDLVTRSKVAAVRLSDDFTFETMQNPAGETMETDEFSAQWSERGVNCAAAYRILGDQLPWTFAVHPRANTAPPEELLQLACGLTELDVNFQVHLAPGSASIAKLAFQVPADITVKQVELDRSIGLEPLVWTRPTLDRVVAFFPEPLAGDVRLTLAGTVPLQPAQGNPIPIVTTRGGENLSQLVQVYRRPNSLVQIDGLSRGNSATERTISHPWGAEAYLVESFIERPERTTQLNLQVHENRSEFQAQSLTRFDPAVGVAFTSRIQAMKGIVDSVNLEVPADWIGPLDISPPAQLFERGIVDQGRRLVQIHLMNPVQAGETVVLRFSGSIAATNDDARPLPILRLLDAQRDDSYVAIPAEDPAGDDRWLLEGVVEAELPPELTAESRLPAGSRILRVPPGKQREYVVRYLPMRHELSQASLALADVTVTEDESGSQIFATQFLLPPIEERELSIEWPPGHEPIAVYLEDQLLTRVTMDVRRWRLPVGPTELPVALTAVSRSPSDNQNYERTLERPRLIGSVGEYLLPLTLWKFESLQSILHRSDSVDNKSSAIDHSLLRLARLTQLISGAEPQLVHLAQPDRQVWKQVWANRLREESQLIEQLEEPVRAGAGETVGSPNELTPQDELRFKAAELLSRLAEAEGAATSTENHPSVRLASSSSAFAGSTQYLVVSGPESRLMLRPVAEDLWSMFPHAALTLLVVAMAAGLLRFSSRIDLLQFLIDHPRWLVAGLGILWCFFLTPAAIGVALSAAAVLSGLADRWLRLRNFRAQQRTEAVARAR